MKLILYLIFILSPFDVYARSNFRPLIPRLAERGWFNNCENGRKNILSMLEGTFQREDLNDVAAVKTEAELDQWMKCYATPSAVAAYENAKPSLKELEKDFGPPFALMACKIWQETRWVNGQTSMDNAKGLVQILPQQVKTLKDIMSLVTTKDPPAQVKEYKRLNEEHIKAMKAISELKTAEAESQALDFYVKKEQELQNKIFDLRKNNEIVRNYDYAIVMQSAWQDWATRNGYPPTICPTGNCYQEPYQKLKWSLAAGALNSLYLMLKLDDDYALKNTNGEEKMTYSREEFKLIIAAAYNSGQSGPVQELKPQDENEEDEYARIKKFLANIKARSGVGPRGWNQTVCYVSNMDSCLRPGNFVPSSFENPQNDDKICKESAGESLQLSFQI